ncbi:MAG TPA: hypothetical protein VFO05_05005 [Candidatus Limnocylindrales bacterium]|nr:hypothetical protein [Candidatus Limnocylindrales bacterium]
MVIGTVGLTGSAHAGRPNPGPTDITSTVRGQQLARTAAARFEARSEPTDQADLRVLRVDDGDYVVYPSWLPVPVASTIATADGGHDFVTTVDVGSAAVLASTDGPRVAHARGTVAAGPTAILWSHGCFARLENSNGWFDTCFKIWKAGNDGNGTNDYFTLDFYGTASNKDRFLCCLIYNAWLEAKKSGTTTQRWFDWSPRGDRTGGCASVTLSVELKIVSVSDTVTMCEKWQPTKFSEAGHFKMTWDCGCVIGFGVDGAREVAFLQTVYVAQGRVPTWTLIAGFHAV